MGSDKVDTSGKQQEYGLVKPLFLDEHPAHRVELPAYYIDRYEVSNVQYKKFVRETGVESPFLGHRTVLTSRIPAAGI